MTSHSDGTTVESPPNTGTTEGYHVPSEEDGVVCEYCGAPFADARFRALHWGLEHDERLTDDQQARFEEAVADETDDLRLFRLKALGLLVLVYFGLMMAYAVFA